MTEFITTFPNDVTNAAYVKNLCIASFDGSESTVTSTGADSRYQRVVDTLAPIANREFTFSVTVRKPAAETVTGARLLISDVGFTNLLTKSITLTDSDVNEFITHTFNPGTAGNSVVVRIDYPEPQQVTNGHQIIVKEHSLVDSVGPAIDDIDGDDTITDGQGTATVTVSGFASAPDDIRVTDGTFTTDNLFVGGSDPTFTFSAPDLANQVGDSAAGQPDWFEGSLQLVVAAGAESAQAPFTWQPAADWDTNTINGNTTATGSISENRGSPYSDGSSSYFPTTDSTSINGSGEIFTSKTENFNVKAWASDTGTIRRYCCCC